MCGSNTPAAIATAPGFTPVVIAPMPPQPFPGSIATASTLAFALVHKDVDGTPLYRVAQTFERAGVPISRGALAHWVIGSSERHLHRIYDSLRLKLQSQALIHGDETTVQVLKEKNKEATSTSYMWAYRSGEDSDEPIVLLDYQPGRGQIHPQTFLGDYRGILVSDGFLLFNRYKDDGLEALADRSRRPVRYANQLPDPVEAMIVRLKKEKPHWGTRKIRELLVKKLAGDVRIPASSTVHAVLDRHGLVRQARKRNRANKAMGTTLSQAVNANDLWCADFKGEFKLGNGRYCYPLTVTDQASRYLLACKAFESTREQR